MKISKAGSPILIAILVLTLAQTACGLGSQASGQSQSQPASNDGSPAAQPSAATSDRGTPDEAKAMLQKAIAHYDAVGRDQALKDFNNEVPPFKDRDLYVACIDSHLTISANGGFPNLVGSSIEPISRAAWDSASTNTINSVDYQWINPVSGHTEPKAFFYMKVGTDVCGVGAYNP